MTKRSRAVASSSYRDSERELINENNFMLMKQLIDGERSARERSNNEIMNLVYASKPDMSQSKLEGEGTSKQLIDMFQTLMANEKSEREKANSAMMEMLRTREDNSSAHHFHNTRERQNTNNNSGDAPDIFSGPPGLEGSSALPPVDRRDRPNSFNNRNDYVEGAGERHHVISKEAEHVKIKNYPTPEEFREWRQNIRDSVCEASGDPIRAMQWITEVGKPEIKFEKLTPIGSWITLDQKL